MKVKTLGLILGLAVLTAGCASSDKIVMQEGFGEAYEIVNAASEASEKSAREFLPYSQYTHPGVGDYVYSSGDCNGFNKDPVSLIDTEASCNRFKLEKLEEFQYGDTAVLGALTGALAAVGGDLTFAATSTAHSFASEYEVGRENQGQIPDHLQSLSEDEKALLKLAGSLDRRKNLEEIGRDKMGQVASASSTEVGGVPQVPTHYFLGWLPGDYADSPLGVIKRLEMTVSENAERLLKERGYKLDPKSIIRSNYRKDESVSRGVYGPDCGDYAASKEKHFHAIYGTPCNLQFRIGYGGDKQRHADGIGPRYTFNDPSEIVQRVTLPQKGLPDRLSHLSGETVWRINPEAALEDMKFVLYMPPTAQFDVESFYKSLSKTLPGDMFFHVAFNEAFPVWTGKDLEMRGVPYMLDHGEELTYLEIGHEAFQ